VQRAVRKIVSWHAFGSRLQAADGMYYVCCCNGYLTASVSDVDPGGRCELGPARGSSDRYRLITGPLTPEAGRVTSMLSYHVDTVSRTFVEL